MTKRSQNLLLAGAIVLFCAAVALFLYKRYFGGPDEAGARVEVQEWYDARFHGAVRVRDCDFVPDPAGREFDRYRCAITIRGRDCAAPRLFLVPAKDELHPQDFPPQPFEPRLDEDRC